VIPLLDILEGVGYALDTPGAYTRGALAGRPGERVSGSDLLSTYGWENDTSRWDAHDFAAPLAEMLLDPLNLIGAGAIGKTAKAAGLANKANAASDAMRAAGAMPEEIAGLTKLTDSAGDPMRLFHGTGNPDITLRDLSPDFAGAATDDGLYGRGTYMTPEPRLASEYVQGRSGQVMRGFGDSRKPFEFTFGSSDMTPLSGVEFAEQVGKLVDPSEITEPELYKTLLKYVPEKTQDQIEKWQIPDSLIRQVEEMSAKVPYSDYTTDKVFRRVGKYADLSPSEVKKIEDEWASIAGEMGAFAQTTTGPVGSKRELIEDAIYKLSDAADAARRGGEGATEFPYWGKSGAYRAKSADDATRILKDHGYDSVKMSRMHSFDVVPESVPASEVDSAIVDSIRLTPQNADYRLPASLRTAPRQIKKRVKSDTTLADAARNAPVGGGDPLQAALASVSAAQRGVTKEAVADAIRKARASGASNQEVVDLAETMLHSRAMVGTHPAAQFAKELQLPTVRTPRPILEEVALFDPQSQLYSPYIAPAYQDVPSNTLPLLAMLGYNAGMVPERTN